MCVHTQNKVTFRFTCPDTGFPVDGTYEDETGRLTLWPDYPVDSNVNQRKDCFMWCIRSEFDAFLAWGDARTRLIDRGVNPAEL